MSRHPGYYAILATCVGASCFFSACGKSEPTAKPAVPVRVAAVEPLERANGSRYSANIVPTSQVDLSFKSSGYITSIRMVRGSDGNMRKIDEGDWVQQGTVLAVVDQDDFQNRLQQANSQLERAKAELEKARLQFERTSTLYRSQSATKPELDRDTAQYESAKASLDGAKAQVSEAQIALQYCSLQAPFDGWIVKRNVDVGALVGPATNGFSLINTKFVKAVFGIPDTAIQRVKLGDAHEVTTEALAKSFAGKVTSISPTADPKSRVYSVEVTIANPHDELKSGMIASITLQGPELKRSLLAVPIESLIRDPQHPGGFAVMVAVGTGETAMVEARPVELGDPYGNMVAITRGVSIGERVVTRGSTIVQNGDQVRVIP